MHTSEDAPGAARVRETAPDSTSDPMVGTATYSPEDNKLRLFPRSRLLRELYDRVKAAGFKWAPKQELFVAPMWTPEREDLLLELCGEIGDEDTSLVDRAEERAERFEEYSDKRGADAERAREAVSAIADNIPLGQPILVGHHSEKHARKDAERIQNGMRKAIKMWETSKYWTDRAAGALRHAKYKELPDVRHRRIKGLESDKRKEEKHLTLWGAYVKMWSKEGLTREQALASVANYDHITMPPAEGRPYGESLWSVLEKDSMPIADVATYAVNRHMAGIERARRWVQHFDNRIAYERAMLAESGGIAADRFKIEIGGRVLCGGWRKHKGYLVVLRVTRKDGLILSVRTTEGLVSVEDVEDYREPETGDADKVKAATKLPPLVNYPGEGFQHMTSEEFKKRAKHSDFWHIKRVKATEEHGAYRVRAGIAGAGDYKTVYVYVTDAKRVERPAPEVPRPPLPEPGAPPPRALRKAVDTSSDAPFEAMKETLRSGVKVVSAPELFPTPPDLAARMVEYADIQPHHHVLEPSAGTGNILRELVKAGPAYIAAVEVNTALADALRATFGVHVFNMDFLDNYGPETERNESGQLGFDRVVMNPPFSADIDHVMHAWKLLREGGILVAVMSAGARFRTTAKAVAFREIVDEHGTMEDLPEDTFKSSGTGVNTVLVTLQKE